MSTALSTEQSGRSGATNQQRLAPEESSCSLGGPMDGSGDHRHERPDRAQDSGRDVALLHLSEGRCRPAALFLELRIRVGSAGHSDAVPIVNKRQPRRGCPSRAAYLSYRNVSR